MPVEEARGPMKLIQEARELLNEERNGSDEANTREMAMVITKLDEAEMWRKRDLEINPRL